MLVNVVCHGRCEFLLILHERVIEVVEAWELLVERIKLLLCAIGFNLLVVDVVEAMTFVDELIKVVSLYSQPLQLPHRY